MARAQVRSQNGKIIVTGSEMDLSGIPITNLAEPIAPSDAATMAFVLANAGGGGGGGAGGMFTVVDTKTTDFNILSSDDKTVFFVDTGLGSQQVVVSLPLSPADGFIVRVASTGNNSWASNTVLIQAPVGQNISSGNSANETITLDGGIGFADFIFDAEASTFSKFLYTLPTGDFKSNGSVAMTGQLEMNGQLLNGFSGLSGSGTLSINDIQATGDISSDTGVYANELYAYNSIISEGTGSFGGEVNMNGNKIVGLSDPASAQDAATMAFVLANAGAGASTDLSNLAAPTAVNQSLIPSANYSKSLGSNGFSWLNAFFLRAYASFGGVKIAELSGYIAGGQNPFVTDGGVGLQVTGSDGYLITSNEGTTDSVKTGDLNISSGSKTAGSGNSGGINIQTGNSAGGTAGNIIMNPGAANNGAGARGNVAIVSQLDMSSQRITNLATPSFGTDAANKAYVDSAAGGSGANQTLSNLTAPVSFNQDLIPSADGEKSIGSVSTMLLGVYSYLMFPGFGSVRAYFGAQATDIRSLLQSSRLPVSTGAPFLSTESAPMVISSGINSGLKTNVYIVTKDKGDPGIESGLIKIGTGDSSTAASGDIELVTGQGATRGKIHLNAVLNLQSETAPAAPANGDMWFDGTSLKLRLGGVTKTVTLT